MSEHNMQQRYDDEISLRELILKFKEIWRYLLSKWMFIVPLGLLGGGLGIVYSIIKEPVYVAKLSFSVVEKERGASGLASLAGQFGLSVGGGGENIFTGENILELMKSRNLTEKTLLSKVTVNGQPCRLIEYYIAQNPFEEDKNNPSAEPIGFPLGQERADFSRAQDSLLNVLNFGITSRNLSVSKVNKNVSIIVLEFRSNSELFSKLFSEILVQEVSDFYVQTKTKTSRSNLASMEARADSLKNAYEKALIGRAVIADRNLNAARQIMGVEEQKYQTQIQLMGTAYAELVKNVEILKLDLVRETPLVQIIDRPILPLENERLGKIKGLVLGGFLGGFLAVTALLGMYFYRRIMTEEQR